MRLFVGIRLDDTMRDAVYGAAEAVRGLFPGRYGIRDNYHVTLAFIGQAEEATLPVIRGAMEKAAGRAEAFPIALSGLGYFRQPQDAVLFCGLQKASSLERLAKDMLEELTSAGLPLQDAGFHAHITLARQAKIRPEMLTAIPVGKAGQQVEAVTLFESCRVEGQLRYVPLFACRLGK